jgi:hypothetical protein
MPSVDSPHLANSAIKDLSNLGVVSIEHVASMGFDWVGGNELVISVASMSVTVVLWLCNTTRVHIVSGATYGKLCN